MLGPATRRPSAPPALLLAAIALAPALASSGCGGGGGGQGELTNRSGTVAVGITDAPSDDVAVFEVEVRQVTLRRSGAAQSVSLLAEPVRVDLAQLRDTTEIVGVSSLPVGAWETVDVTLDLSSATLQLATATATEPAVLRTRDGRPFTGVIERRVVLGDSLIRVPGAGSTLLAIDLDLESALSVDAATNTVVVDPVVLAEAGATASKPVRVSGLIDSSASSGATPATGTAAPSDFVLDLRPAIPSTSHGLLGVRSDDATVFIVDGASLSGADAAAVLGQHLTERTLVLGAFEGGALTARTVLVGTSLPEVSQDRLTGIVVDRADAGGTATLSVRGALVARAAGGADVLDRASVTLDPASTLVLADGVRGLTATADAIDVGSTVTLFGTWSAASRSLSSVSVARVHLSSVVATLLADPEQGGLLRTRLLRVGPFDASAFGAGSWSAASFTIDAGGLAAPAAGEAVRAVGRFAGPGTSEPDFRTAGTLVRRSAVESALEAEFTSPFGTPLVFLDPQTTADDRLGLVLAGPGLVSATLDPGTLERFSLEGAQSFALTPLAGRDFVGAITVIEPDGARVTRMFSTLGSFQRELSRLAAAGALSRVTLRARGAGTPAGSELAADRVVVEIDRETGGL